MCTQLAVHQKLNTNMQSPECITKKLLSLLREHVQISASGRADADQLGADFFWFRLQLVPIETESATGQTSLSGN